ncbi:MAG: hypothetical protein Q8Q01_04240 [archaeon]|nr:hypothetical protein [archaeon]
MAIDFTNLVRIFDAYGITEFLLPFFLIFTILYAVLAKIKLFEGNNKFPVILATVLSFLVIIPHITGNYPAGYDPIDVINQTLPSIALFAIGAIFLFILLGVFIPEGTYPEWLIKTTVFAVVAFVIYVFGSSLGWWSDPSNTFSWWTDELSELLLILGVFGLIGWFITKSSPPTGQPPPKGFLKDALAWLGTK